MNKWGTVDTKWVVCRAAPLTTTGYNEVVASLMTKEDATAWARVHYGRRWRSVVLIMRRPE